MKITSLLGIVLILVIVISLVSAWFYPSLQDFMAGNRMWNGIRDFSSEFNLKQIDSLTDLPEYRGKNVLICVPYIKYDTDDLSRLKAFVEKGGTLIMMDDFGFGNDFLESAGVEARFSNDILLDPLFCYKNQYLPRITDFSAEIKEGGIAVIGMNHATSLNNIDAENVLACSSNMSYLDVNKSGTRDDWEPGGPLVIASEERFGKGTIELVSDPSLIINTMVEKNNNYDFMEYMINKNGEPENVFLDRSHLAKSPLDTSKMNLETVREIMSHPYVLLGTTGLIFVIITAYTLKKGHIIGRE